MNHEKNERYWLMYKSVAAVVAIGLVGAFGCVDFGSEDDAVTEDSEVADPDSTSIESAVTARRVALPAVVHYMGEYRDRKESAWLSPSTADFWPSYAAYVAVRDGVMLEKFNVISGLTADANVVKSLRLKKKVFAYHVVGHYLPYYGANVNVFANERMADLGKIGHPTKAQVADAVRIFKRNLSAPFLDTLRGTLPGGFDAIAIDELSNDAWDGSVTGYIQAKAIADVRADFPDRLILVASQPRLAYSGKTDVSVNPAGRTYAEIMKSVADNADLLMVENYRWLGQNPNKWAYLAGLGVNLLTNPKAASPATRAELKKKTIYILTISGYTGLGVDKLQDGVYTEWVNEQSVVCSPHAGTPAKRQRCKNLALNFLTKQVQTLRANSVLSKMPGIGFYTFDRADKDLVTKAASLLSATGV